MQIKIFKNNTSRINMLHLNRIKNSMQQADTTLTKKVDIYVCTATCMNLGQVSSLF